MIVLLSMKWKCFIDWQVREESNHTFQIQFFDSSVHYLQVRQDGNAHINRQVFSKISHHFIIF